MKKEIESAESIINRAKQYKDRQELRKADSVLESRIRHGGLADLAYAHMPLRVVKWTKNSLAAVANKYSTSKELRDNHYAAYQAMCRKGLYDELCQHYTDRRRLDFPLDMFTKGIYILYIGDTIVYIGKSSESIKRRLLVHIGKYPDIDKIEIYEIANNTDIDIAEVYLIGIHAPTLNTDCNSGERTTLFIHNLSSVITKEIVLKCNEGNWDESAG